MGVYDDQAAQLMGEATVALQRLDTHARAMIGGGPPDVRERGRDLLRRVTLARGNLDGSIPGTLEELQAAEIAAGERNRRGPGRS